MVQRTSNNIIRENYNFTPKNDYKKPNASLREKRSPAGVLGLGRASKVSLSSSVMCTLTKSATSAFQHGDPVTHNAQGHRHSFIDRM
jgi:hypothetical protein